MARSVAAERGGLNGSRSQRNALQLRSVFREFFCSVNTLHNTNDNAAELAAQLQLLEYAVRRSITVREDQEDAASAEHIAVARGLGISVDAEASKGDLLAAVQTLLRVTQAKPLR
jgi:hypothetical protein